MLHLCRDNNLWPQTLRNYALSSTNVQCIFYFQLRHVNKIYQTNEILNCEHGLWMKIKISNSNSSRDKFPATSFAKILIVPLETVTRCIIKCVPIDIWFRNVTTSLSIVNKCFFKTLIYKIKRKSFHSMRTKLSYTRKFDMWCCVFSLAVNLYQICERCVNIKTGSVIM